MNIQRGLAFGLVMLLVLSGFSFALGELHSDEVSGSVQEFFFEGSGTPGDPYIIYDVDDLQNMSSDLTAHYALANDIDANETSGWNWNETENRYDGLEPIGDYDNRFTGSFDGQNYTITGLYINRPSTDYVGLFGYVGESGDVRNVGVIDADVSGNETVGGLVGHNSFGVVSNSYANGNVSGDWGVGGLVGINYDGTVSNSYATGMVNGNDYVGGLVGWNYYGTVNNSYPTGNVSGNQYVGGLVGWNYAGTVSNSFYNIDSVLINDGHHVTIGGIFDAQYQDWYSSGLYLDIADYNDTLIPSGDYYEISNVQGIRDLLGFAWNESYRFRLSADIDLSTAPGLYIPYLNAEFDGDNYTFSNLFIDMPLNVYLGMFGKVGSVGEIRNVGVVDANVSGYEWVGGLVGENFGSVTNSYATGNASGVRYRVGGLVGRNEGTVSNSYATGNVSGNGNVGGLVGYDYGTVENSYATGNVSGGTNVGGLVGTNTGTVENSYATGNVSGGTNVGGLVGQNWEGTVSNSYARGNVTRLSGSTYTGFGGFVGYNYQSKIINCYSTGSVYYQGTTDPTGKGFAGSVETGGDYEMTGNFWDVDTSGQNSTSGNATGKTTAEMKTQSTFTDAGWDFNNTWHMVEDVTYPLLQWQDLPEAASMQVDLFAYDGSDGWNFVSFNIDLADTSIENILADIDGSYDRLMYYDASTDQWSSYVPGRADHFNNLHSWDNTMGIWIKMNNNETLNLEGYAPANTDITLYPGWNMVGLPSESSGNHGLPEEVSKIGYFDAAEEYNLAYDYDPTNYLFEPGNGYLLYNDADYSVVWTVDY